MNCYFKYLSIILTIEISFFDDTCPGVWVNENRGIIHEITDELHQTNEMKTKTCRNLDQW